MLQSDRNDGSQLRDSSQPNRRTVEIGGADLIRNWGHANPLNWQCASSRVQLAYNVLNGLS